MCSQRGLLRVLLVSIITNGGLSLATSACASSSSPVVEILNGTLSGTYSVEYEQDIFLGIPYSRPPTGDLRFRQAQHLNTTWTGVKNATEYSPQCIGYGSDTWILGNHVSEDCLTLNIVRPSNGAAGLPVGVWIHGGALRNGGSSDPRYNLSFIVQESTYARSPFIAVSINYRLHAWGLLFSKEILDDGADNLAFRDQRLALQWIQENIAAFGGDPAKVTIWGESAGASSVGNQLIAYGGRDDKLFRGAIMQSGAMAESFQTVKGSQKGFDSIVKATNCTKSKDALDCLRKVPVDILSGIFNSSAAASVSLTAALDGDFFRYPSGFRQLEQGKFVKVPILHGTNRDEGTNFTPKGINSTGQFTSIVSSNKTIASTLSALYPDIPSEGSPATLKGRAPASFGTQWKRFAQFIGDRAQHAGRRVVSQSSAKYKVPVFSYDFNVLPAGTDVEYGVSHFSEVAFVMANTKGLGYDTAISKNPFTGAPETNFQVARLMARMWSSFIVDLDPNNSGVTSILWPKYTEENPANYVFDANVTGLAYSTLDNFRVAEIAYVTENILKA